MNETSNERDEISNDHHNNRTDMGLCSDDESNCIRRIDNEFLD